MDPSSEIEAIVEEFLQARAAVDAQAMKSLLSRSHHLRVIGSSESDWTQGYDQAVKGWSGQGGEVRAVPHRTVRRLEAFESGDTGWAAVEQEVTFSDGQTSVVRITLVVVLEGSRWKIAQIHFSVPLAD